ncbi:hypothetical protein [Trichothermofontia sp.]
MPDASRDRPETEADDLASLSVLWAKKYIADINQALYTEQTNRERVRSYEELASAAGRQETADYLLNHLELASATAWSQVEALLAAEVKRHEIPADAVSPWPIIQAIHQTYQQMLIAYAQEVPPARLSVLLGKEFGRVRQQYTARDPRAIGLVSMQFHYTGQALLNGLSEPEQALVSPYLKVMDDHLYMPLQRTYEAAARWALGDWELRTVQQILLSSTAIAHRVCDRVAREYPLYQSYTGPLTSETVRISSVRDTEMFQVYLCLCLLEGSIAAIKAELFPLCIMLYPPLKVDWKLVQSMLQLLSRELFDRLETESMARLLPYLEAVTEMFSDAVVQDLSPVARSPLA